MLRKVIWLKIACFMFFTSCAKTCSSEREAMTPEEVVQAYLDISLNMSEVSQTAELLKLTTGELKSAIEQASEETITNAFIKQNYKLESYSVVERRDRTPRETEITFVLTYRNLGLDKNADPEQSPQVKTENTLAVVREDGAWFIRDVLGKKSSIDFVLGDEITPTQDGNTSGVSPAEDTNAAGEIDVNSGAETSKPTEGTLSPSTP